jgi:type I restriction enzyme M protein
MFFSVGGPTSSILYCEPEIPESYSLSKTRPIKYEWLHPLIDIIENRRETPCSWSVDVARLDENLNLDIKNPRLKVSDLNGEGDLGNLSAALKRLAAEAEELADWRN